MDALRFQHGLLTPPRTPFPETGLEPPVSTPTLYSPYDLSFLHDERQVCSNQHLQPQLCYQRIENRVYSILESHRARHECLIHDCHVPSSKCARGLGQSSERLVHSGTSVNVCGILRKMNQRAPSPLLSLTDTRFRAQFSRLRQSAVKIGVEEGVALKGVASDNV